MHELDQQHHVEVHIHEGQLYQAVLTTPATSKLSYLTAQTLEQHQQPQHQQPQTQQRAHRLERRAAAMQLLVLPKVRRHKRPWKIEGIAPVAVIFRVDPGQQLHRGCEHRRGLINGRPHLGLLTRRLAHPHRLTGHASTSPRHFEHSAAVGMTSA